MARIDLGQNTPLTLIAAFTAESGSSQQRDGLTTVAAGGTYITGGLQHTRDGTGGSYALRITTNQEVILPWGGLIVREALIFFPLFGEPQTTLNVLRGGSEYQGGLEVLEGNAVRLVRGESGGTFTELARSATGVVPEGQYNWACMRYYVADASGHIIFKLHSYQNTVLSYSGDTKNSVAYSNMDALRFLVDGVSGDVRIDDVLVFVRTLYYTGGVGTMPVAGQTITDADTGATLTVDYVEGTAAEGVIVAYGVSTNASFEAGDDIGNGGDWTAIASNHLGDDKASLWISEGLAKPSPLSSDVPDTGDQQWDATNVPPDAHYQQVDDWTDTADYVYTADDAQLDQYGTTAPAVPAGSTVIGLIMSTWGNNSASVSQIRLGYNDGTGDVDGPDQVLPSTVGRSDVMWANNPRTGSSFTLVQISSLTARLTSVA